jgi:hypothetical protein
MKKVVLGLFIITLSNLIQTNVYSQSNPEICMVTVDANSTHNIVFYDKTGHDDAAFYIIYREDQTGSYIALDSIHKDTLSEYHDMTALVNVRAQKYKISVVDTFGVESNLSPYHRTVFCDEPSTGLFAWNWYEIEGQSNPSNEWVMLREDVAGSSGWMAIDTVLGSEINFLDLQTSSFPLGQWRVRNLWGLSCNSTRVGVNTSRSNVRNQTMEPSAIREMEIYQFNIYPNPAEYSLRVTGIYHKEPVVISDLSGKIIFTGNLSGVDPYIDVNDFAAGLYLITIRNTSVKWNKN